MMWPQMLWHCLIDSMIFTEEMRKKFDLLCKLKINGHIRELRNMQDTGKRFLVVKKV